MMWVREDRSRVGDAEGQTGIVTKNQEIKLSSWKLRKQTLLYSTLR